MSTNDNTPRAPVAAVTGGRRGIGRAIATALAGAGFDIVLVDMAEDDDEQTLATIATAGRQARFVTADIADIARREAVADSIFAAFGTLECMVNNAGVVPSVRRLDLLDVTPESFDRVMGINLRGTFFLTQAIARRMAADERTDRPTQRSIITVTSGVVGRPRMDWPEYAFSKTGLSLMSQAFALRLARYGVRTCEIRPGVTRTGMSRDVWDGYEAMIEDGLLPLGRMGEPADIARAVTAFATGMLGHTTGDRIYVDGGLHIPVSQTPRRKPA